MNMTPEDIKAVNLFAEQYKCWNKIGIYLLPLAWEYFESQGIDMSNFERQQLEIPRGPSIYR